MRLGIRIGGVAGWKPMLAGGHSMELTTTSLKRMLFYSEVGGSRVDWLAWCLSVDESDTLASGDRNCSSRKDGRLRLRRDTMVVLRVGMHHPRSRGVLSWTHFQRVLVQLGSGHALWNDARLKARLKVHRSNRSKAANSRRSRSHLLVISILAGWVGRSAGTRSSAWSSPLPSSSRGLRSWRALGSSSQVVSGTGHLCGCVADEE